MQAVAAGVIDAQSLERMRAGDPGARDLVFARLAEWLGSIARAKKKKYPVLNAYLQTFDISQDTLARLLEVFSDPARIPADPGHLLAVAAKVLNGIAVDRVRKYLGAHGPASKEQNLGTDLDFVDDGTGVVEDAIREQERERTRRAVARLDLADQRVVVLRHCGLTFPEVAEALGMAETHVRSRHKVATRRLTAWLRDGEGQGR